MTFGAFAGPRYGRSPARREAKWGIGAIGLLVVLLGAIVAHKLYAGKTELPASEQPAPAQTEPKEGSVHAESLFGDFQLELPAKDRGKPAAGKATPKIDQQDPFAAAGATRPVQAQPRSTGTTPTSTSGPTAPRVPVWASSHTPQQTSGGATRYQRSVQSSAAPRAMVQAVPTEQSEPLSAAPAGQAAGPVQNADPFATPASPLSASGQSREAAKLVPSPDPTQNGHPTFQGPIRQTEHTEAAPLFDLTGPQPAPAATPAPAPKENVFVPVQIETGHAAGAVAIPTPAPIEPPRGDAAAEPAPWTFEASEAVPLPETPRPETSETARPNPFAEQQAASPAALSSPTPSVPQVAATDQIHEVVPGDNYWTVSREHYGAGRYFAALAEYNRQRIPRPEKLKPGMKVLIPDVSVLEQRYPKLTGQSQVEKLPPGVPEEGFFVDANGQPLYRIGKGDTLTEIAQTHLGRMTRWTEILVMNREQLKNPNALKLGMILRLPRDASRVTLAPEDAVIR